MQLICGINPVLEALHAGTRHFDRLLVVKGVRNRRISEAISRAGRMGVPLRFESRETLDRMSGGIPHQGLIAVVSAKPVTSLEELVAQARTPALLVLLDGVEDPRNLGAILRTVDAAGADGVLLPDRHSAGLSETVARASAGGVEHVKVARIGNVAQALERLKEEGVWVVGFDAAGTERWDAVDFKRPICLVLGGEGRGIRRLVRERCDHLVSLPLFGHVGSLNVSVAAGIALYEVVRQRGTVPSHVRPIPLKNGPLARHVIGPGPEDGEQDPGARQEQGAAAPAGEDDESTVTLAFDHDEEPTWAAAGPTILKAPRHRETRVGGPARPRRTRHGGRQGGGPVERRIAPRPERPRREPVDGPPPAQGGDGPPAEPVGSGERVHRKRPRNRGERNREARPGASLAPGDAEAGSRPPRGEPGSAPDPPAGENPAAGDGQRQGRRRRRRRRR